MLDETNNSNNEHKPELTPEQQLELERERNERAKAEVEALRLKAELTSLESQRQEIARKEQFAAQVFETNLQFHMNNAELEAMLKSEGHELVYDNGKCYSTLNGKRVKLATLLEHIALNERPHIVERTSLERLRQSAPATIQAKDQLTTIAAKNAYINSFGIEKYELLPLHHHGVQGLPTTQAEFFALPVKEKSRLITEKGSDWVGRLPKR